MPKKLLIAEKPSVAVEFAKALKIKEPKRNGYIESSEYVITWCVGHLVTMSYPEVYDEKYKMWRFDTLPFIPEKWKYEVINNVKNQFDIVNNLLKREDIETIYVCTDSGREGEYIYRLVDQMVGVKEKKKKRVWIDSQTEEEILKGIKNAKDLKEYDNLSDSAYLRAKEDYLIGINFSRLLTLLYGKKIAELNKEEKVVISIGRVMTCVLGMVVEREYEIKNFIKTKFYKVQAKFNEGLIAEWKLDKENQNELQVIKDIIAKDGIYNENGFKIEEDAKAFINFLNSQNGECMVLEVSKKNQKENAPLLYNLAELQNECSKKYKISPDKTLEIAQELYEKKLITYPRTDARVLSKAVSKEIKNNLNGIFKWKSEEEISNVINIMIENKYNTDIEKTKYVNDSKITDHYAIIPTGKGYENYEKLSDLSKKIYKLITKRLLSIFFPPAEYSKLSVTIGIENQKFYANSKICTKKGYLVIYENSLSNDKDLLDDTDKEELNNESNNLKPDIKVLSKLKKGQKLNLSELFTKEGETSPPSRYTSGSIILAMENAGKLIEDERLREQIKGNGIGTSATRAEIIKKLNRIEYIETNSKTQVLTPTNKGELIYKVTKYSVPDMLNPELTASWEKGLEMVAKGEIKSEEFMKKLEKYIKGKIEKAKSTNNKYDYY